MEKDPLRDSLLRDLWWMSNDGYSTGDNMQHAQHMIRPALDVHGCVTVFTDVTSLCVIQVQHQDGSR